MIWIVPAVILAVVLILACLLAAASPGKLEPYRDDNGKPLAGSISEKTFLTINGAKQGMFITGKDQSNPVLLFLHGGPGMPEYAIGQKYPAVLDDIFTVCWWEQRGAGISNRPDLPPDSITVEQLVSDTIAVTQYLRKRFGQEKIYLMAHSWGTRLGIEAAACEPGLYHAYIGMAQITQQMQSEKLAYQYMLEQFNQAGNTRMVRRLEAIPLPQMDSMPQAYRRLRDVTMHMLGIGTTREMKSVEGGIFLPVMESGIYTLGEKIGLWRGKWSAHTTRLWNQLLSVDITALVPKLDLPVYFFHGVYDYTVLYPLTKAYFENLQAPLKGFYTFENSAHSPLFEEPEKVLKILREDVLAGTTALADEKLAQFG